MILLQIIPKPILQPISTPSTEESTQKEDSIQLRSTNLNPTDLSLLPLSNQLQHHPQKNQRQRRTQINLKMIKSSNFGNVDFVAWIINVGKCV